MLCAARARALVPAHSCQRADNVLVWPAVTLPSFILRRSPRRRRSLWPPRSAALSVATAPYRRQGQLPSPWQSQRSQPPCQPSQSARATRASSQASSQVRAVGSCHARPKMTSRFRRLPAMTRGQAPRPGVVEDRSSCADHHHRIRSMKMGSSFYQFPLKISGTLRGNFPGI